MKTAALLLPLALLPVLSGCSDGSAGRAAEAIASPVTAPINAAVNNTAPLPQESQYTYWRKQPGTNLVEPYVTDHPLSEAEKQELGILPPAP